MFYTKINTKRLSGSNIMNNSYDLYVWLASCMIWVCLNNNK